MSKLFIALVGDPGCGFRAIGPYSSGTQAFGENHMEDGGSVCTLELSEPKTSQPTKTTDGLCIIIGELNTAIETQRKELAEAIDDKRELQSKLVSAQRALDEERRVCSQRLQSIEALRTENQKLEDQVTHLTNECDTWEETHKKVQDALVKSNLIASMAKWDARWHTDGKRNYWAVMDPSALQAFIGAMEKALGPCEAKFMDDETGEAKNGV